MEAKSNILLVDDEPRFIDSLQNILTQCQYNCTKTLTGLKAIEQLKSGTFDLALLDINLPDVSGCDLVQFIKTSKIPTAAVMLTGEQSIETAVNAMKLGAYDFLRKPVNYELLTKTIDKALQHNKIECQLQVSEQRFKTLAESAWEAVIIYENDNIIEANSQFLNMFGYTHREMLEGIVFRNIFAPASAQNMRQFIEQKIDGSSELSGKKKDGTEFFIDVKFRQLTYLSKPRWVCVIRDISERVRLEKERLSMQQKLAAANKHTAMGLMAGSVAHDLNNILAGIVSYPDLLLMQMSETDKYYEPIKKIQTSGKRAAAVVSDLVAITRAGVSPHTVENVNDIIMDYFSSIEHDELQANFPNIVFETKLYENLYNVCCSLHSLHKILINLIRNASEAIEEKGTIRISTDNCQFSHPFTADKAGAKSSDSVRLTISDNGPGISQKDAEKIFDPFYTTKIMGKGGTGLGLSIVWNIVLDHNGWIEIKDNKPRRNL